MGRVKGKKEKKSIKKALTSKKNGLKGGRPPQNGVKAMTSTERTRNWRLREEIKKYKKESF